MPWLAVAVQSEYLCGLEVASVTVGELPDGSKEVSWDVVHATPAGMPAIPVRKVIWRLNEQGNRGKVVTDHYIDMFGDKPTRL